MRTQSPRGTRPRWRQDLLSGEFSREDENEADEVGVRLANKVGYSPTGMLDVLKKIDARNNGREDRNGLFASHPATKDRIDQLQKQIADEKLTGKATAEARYTSTITFDAKPASEIAMDVAGAAGLASGDKKKDDDKDKNADDKDKKTDEPKKKGSGLSSITGNKQAQNSQQASSAGARGGLPDRDAIGGPNKNALTVKITAAELDAFKKGIVGLSRPFRPHHLILGVAAIAATLGLMSLTANRLIRRKLRLSLVLFVGYMAIDVAMAISGLHITPDTQTQLAAFAKLALAAALINAVVFLLVNPLRADRVPDHFPIILQDAIVIGLILLASTFLSSQLVTTSAVSAVVLGFALQDTLGNAFAGLAIQSEKPFHVGQWVKVADYEGRVAEVTWRATKLRTKTGNLVILPNNMVAKEAIVNYSEPAAPFRLEVEVGASYLVPPNQVKAAMMEALRHSSHVMTTPAPDVLLINFDDSAITYRARFWIDDYAADEASRDEVRTAIYYSFQRHNIEIPWPIQIQYEKDWKEPDVNDKVAEEEQLLAGVDLFSTLPPSCAARSRARRRWPSTAAARPSSARERTGSRCSSCCRAA